MFFGIKKNFLPIFLFLLTFLIYLHNLSRSVYGGDVGDLVTSAIVMGVPHPSGYPLFTFLGFLLTRIHFLTPAFMVGLISVFSSSIAVVLFYLFSFELTKNRFIALLSALVLAFNYLFWFYAEIAEVFALNNLFVVLLIFLAYIYFKYKKIKFLYLLALFTGLSMTNNYTISFIFPSLAILVFSNYKEFLKKPKIILQCFLLALLGFSVVLYIPIASFFNPPINWVSVKDLGTFFDVISRKFYGTFGVGITPNLALMQKVIIQKSYFLSLFYQLTFPVIFICILGAVSLLKRNKLLFIFFVLGFLLSGPFFISLIGLPLQKSFFIGVYERFFTMSSVILLFFFPIGLQFFVNILNNFFKKNTYKNLFIAVFFIIPLLLFKYNFNKTDLHNLWVGDNLAYDIIGSLPKNSFIMIFGDTSLFNSWYVHYGLKFRPDVTLLSLVGNNPSIKKVTDNYLKKFPKNSKDPNLIAKTLLDLSTTAPVFSSVPVQSSKGKKSEWAPYGLIYKLENDLKKIPSESEFVKTQSKIWNEFKNKDINKINYLGADSLTISEIASAYSNALIAQGDYVFTQYHDSRLALSYFNKAIVLDSNPNAYLVLGVFHMSNLNCSKALDNLEKTIEIDPLNNKAYYFLYINYKFCFKDNAKAEQVLKNYNAEFKGDFFKDLKVNDIKIDI